MRKIPHLTVVDPASTGAEPPPTLGDPGRALWTQVLSGTIDIVASDQAGGDTSSGQVMKVFIAPSTV